MPGKQARKRCHEIDQHRSLLGLDRPEIDRRAKVKQEPGRDIPVLGVLPDVRRIHARRYIPIDVADIIVGLVFAQIREIHAIAIEQAAIISLQPSIQPADDLPVYALEDALRR